MTTFDTPQPIALSLELAVGDVRIVASDRDDTVVDVRPSDPAKTSDVTAARQTRVEYANGSLLVKAPKGWRYFGPSSRHGSIDVRIELPADSTVRGSAGVAALHCSGRIGECRYRTGVGDIALERTGPVELNVGAGDVTAHLIKGKAQIKTAGAVRIGRIDGAAAVKNSNGDTWIGEITGEGRINAANGQISVDLASSGIVAKTANGDVHLDEVVSGSVVAQTAFGSVGIGVREGVPAWLDLETKFGNVGNHLAQTDPPERGEDAVEVHAHTSMGDVVVRRSSVSSIGRNEP